MEKMTATPAANDRMSLAARAWIRYVLSFATVSAVLFGSAGTVDYWQAKLHLTSLFGGAFAFGFFLLRAAPDLLERRLRARETRRAQRGVVALGIPATASIYVVPGLARRWGRLNVPDAAALVAMALVMVSYLAICYVLWSNRFAGRTIAVEESQKVVATGPYAWVRHPMYTFVLALYLLTPVSLGSYHGVVPAALMAPILAHRMRDEEEALRDDLDGCAEYMDKVPYRLIPHVY
jgi:protein-S-isoprenylcysteine O-methyltransferase Ste14